MPESPICFRKQNDQMTTDGFAVLMQATRARVARIRLLQWLLPLVPLACGIALGTMSPQEWRQDFGKSAWGVAGACAIVALAALLPLAAWYLAGRYVEAVAVDPDRALARVTLLLPWGRREVIASLGDFVADGVLASTASGTGLYTPTFGLRLRSGRRLIVDMQAAFPHGVGILFAAFHTPERLPALLQRQAQRRQRTASRGG